MFKKLREMIELFGGERVPGVLAAVGVSQEQYDTLRAKVHEAKEATPRIAFVGETGVGKSTTFKALFHHNVPVSDTKACTQHATEYVVERGKLVVVDMPGLGESVEADKDHMALYAKELPSCDVALWVFKADNRAISNIERCLTELIAAEVLDPRKLVIALNQVDALQPLDWNTNYNIPSEAQEKTIEGRVADVQSKLGKIQGLDASRIVAYSALKNYRLADLLKAMKDAADRRVQWVLGDLADFRGFDDDIKDPDGSGAR